MSRQLPPSKCCMCGLKTDLHLQYKVGQRPWQDASITTVDGRKAYRISKLATCLRWLCERHWQEDLGRFGLSKHEEALKRFWNWRDQQSRIKTNPKRLLD